MTVEDRIGRLSWVFDEKDVLYLRADDLVRGLRESAQHPAHKPSTAAWIIEYATRIDVLAQTLLIDIAEFPEGVEIFEPKEKGEIRDG